MVLLTLQVRFKKAILDLNRHFLPNGCYSDHFLLSFRALNSYCHPGHHPKGPTSFSQKETPQPRTLASGFLSKEMHHMKEMQT